MIFLCHVLLCFVTRIGVLGETEKHNMVSKFLLKKRQRLIMENFRMPKSMLFHTVDELKPTLMKKNTKYKNAILVEICVSCVIYKLVHACNFLICNELFIIGKSITSLVLHEFVDAINVVFKKLISWPMGAELCSILNDFKLLCGLLNIQGAIDGIHFFISEPFMPFLEYYYYFKFG